MTVLVTGGNGFLGSRVVDELLRRGYKVRCLVRKKSNLRWLKDKPVELLYWKGFLKNELDDGWLDLTNALQNDVDYIVHAAGVVASKTKAGFFKGNQLVTRQLLEMTKFLLPEIKRFLYVSSMAATGPTGGGEPRNEWDLPWPLTTYGKSKYEAEREVEWASRFLKTTIVRPPAIYGPRDTATLPFFKAIKRGIAPLVGSKPKYVNLVHVSDVARGIVDAMESENTVNKTYFVGSEREYSWDEIAKTAADCLGKSRIIKLHIPAVIVLVVAGLSGFLSWFRRKPSVLNFEKGRDMIQRSWACNIGRAQREFGYKPLISLEEGFKNTIEWYKNNNWL